MTAECWSLSSAPVFSIGDFELSKDICVFVADAEMKTQDVATIKLGFELKCMTWQDKAQIKKCYHNNVKKKRNLENRKSFLVKIKKKTVTAKNEKSPFCVKSINILKQCKASTTLKMWLDEDLVQALTRRDEMK